MSLNNSHVNTVNNQTSSTSQGKLNVSKKLTLHSAADSVLKSYRPQGIGDHYRSKSSVAVHLGQKDHMFCDFSPL